MTATKTMRDDHRKTARARPRRVHQARLGEGSPACWPWASDDDLKRDRTLLEFILGVIAETDDKDEWARQDPKAAVEWAQRQLEFGLLRHALQRHGIDLEREIQEIGRQTTSLSDALIDIKCRL